MSCWKIVSPVFLFPFLKRKKKRRIAWREGERAYFIWNVIEDFVNGMPQGQA